MALKSRLFAGNQQLALIEQRRLTLKTNSPTNNREAIALVQSALIALGHPMPSSTRKTGSPDGIYGPESMNAVINFQHKAFPASPGEWDGKVGPKTLTALDAALMKSGNKATKPVPAGVGTGTTPGEFICGPDVTKEVAMIWRKIQNFFNTQSTRDKFRLCKGVLLPVKILEDKPGGGYELQDRKLADDVAETDGYGIEYLKRLAQSHADIASWEVMPLFQSSSEWLRTPPIHYDNTKGPLAVPTIAPNYENPKTCAHSVQVGGACWLNGSVNYGTFGIMVRLCSDFARSNPILSRADTIVEAFSLGWAEMLIRAYKRFGPWVEPPEVPIAWTRATFRGGPSGKPSIPGNRPKCTCKEGPTGSVVKWDFVWEPVKTRAMVTNP